MKRLSLLTLCAGLLIQSFVMVAVSQETATPPEGGAAPKVDTNAPATTTTTTTTTTSTEIVGPESGEANSASKAAQFEMTKRQELAFTANQAISDGERLLSAGQLDAAAERFKYALDNLPEGGTSAPAYQKAASGMADVLARQGDAGMKSKKYDVAVKSYQEACNYQPSNESYRNKLENAKQAAARYDRSAKEVAGTENNPALTPQFREKLAQIQKLFFEGDRLYDTGQYDAAENRYMQILALDSYNKAARGRLERLDRTRMRTAEKMRDATRAAAMNKVTELWSEKVPVDYAKKGQQKETDKGGESKLARMTRKLQEMRIPSLNFNQADIQTVVQVLTAKSRELDSTKDGINFVLQTESAAPAAPTKPGEKAEPAAPAPAIPAVTINLQDVPMLEALRFISSITNLQVKVEEYAVYLLPQNAVSSVLQTRTFAVPGGFFEGGLKAQGQKPGSTETTKVDSVKIDVKQQLIDKGIQFPDGATAAFLSGSSRLVVKNTPDQLDVIAALISASNIETPQVEIETRLTEFTDDQLKALTFNYLYSMDTSLFSGANPMGYPTMANVGTSGITALGEPSNAQVGSLGAIVPNSLDAVLATNTSQVDGAPRNFLMNSGTVFGSLTTQNFNVIGIGAVLGKNAMGVIINLIDNMKGIDLLSAPKVTAKNRTRAKVEIVRELRYPSEFERPTVNSTPFSLTIGTNVFGNPVTTTVYLALPATPRQFTVKPIGVTLEVTPTTYPDQRIDLELQPEVVDFEGFINYGQAIRVRNTTTNPSSQGTVQTDSVVNQPVFNVRSMSTKVQVLDGQTVVLGGLIREDRQTVKDKVPFLGDLPLIGRAFQSKVEKSIKRNLMIFVTAKLMKSDGKNLYNQDLAVAEPTVETVTK